MEVFRSGAEVTDTFPKASALQTGNGALRMTRFAAPNGASPGAGSMLDPGGSFVDTQGRACSVKEAVDGSLRCLPARSEVNEAGYWKDAACKERLYLGADPNAQLSELRVVTWQGPIYQTIEALFSLSIHEGPVYQVVQTQCVSAVPEGPTPLLAKGTELPLSSLPSLEATTL